MGLYTFHSARRNFPKSPLVTPSKGVEHDGAYPQTYLGHEMDLPVRDQHQANTTDKARACEKPTTDIHNIEKRIHQVIQQGFHDSP